MRLLLTTTAILAGLLSAHAAQVGNWSITYSPDSNNPNGCIMTADYESGTRVALIVTKSYEWALGFANPAWNQKEDDVTDVAAYVDGRFIASGKAIAISSQIAALPLGGAEAFKALQAGRGLVIRTPRGELSFSLQGTARAMRTVIDCVNSIQSTTKQAGPAPTQSADSPSNFELVPAGEATAILTNLLSAASLSGFKLVPPKEGGGAVLFTLADGTRGQFLAARGLGTVTADEYAGRIIESQSKKCTGNYLSGKQAVPSTDGSVVRKIITSCEEGGAPPVVMETTIIRQQSGFLMDIAQITPDGAVSGVDDSPVAAHGPALIDAAIRFSGER